MKNSYVIYSVVALIITLFISSCLVEPKYPYEPTIKFNSLDFIYNSSTDVEDSFGVSVDFQDGNGDLGLNQVADEDPKFALKIYKSNSDTGEIDTLDNPDYFNFLISLFIQNSSGEFEEYVFPDGLTLNGRFPRLNTSDKAKPLEGTITFYKKVTPGFEAVISEKIIKFKVSIKDRELNLSNEVETDTLQIPQLF